MGEIRQTLNRITVKRWVATAKGSWRWQVPYQLTEYCIRENAKTGELFWYATCKSGKHSLPQIGRSDKSHYRVSQGLHNNRVSVRDMAHIKDKKFVNKLVKAGFKLD